MKLSATPLTAALAGIFSAIVWPLLWSRFGNPASTGTFELVVGTILVIALPAHAFVVGFQRRPTSAERGPDTALLKRIGAWLGAAIVTALVSAAMRA